MNSIDAQIIEMINNACDRVNDGELDGLVVGNEAANFSVGANIGLVGMLIMAEMWDELEQAIRGRPGRQHEDEVLRRTGRRRSPRHGPWWWM